MDKMSSYWKSFPETGEGNQPQKAHAAERSRHQPMRGLVVHDHPVLAGLIEASPAERAIDANDRLRPAIHAGFPAGHVGIGYHEHATVMRLHIEGDAIGVEGYGGYAGGGRDGRIPAGCTGHTFFHESSITQIALRGEAILSLLPAPGHLDMRSHISLHLRVHVFPNGGMDQAVLVNRFEQTLILRGHDGQVIGQTEGKDVRTISVVPAIITIPIDKPDAFAKDARF